MGNMNLAMSTPVVIMAGGPGTRMKPYSDVLPKPLLIYNKKTLIENVISLLAGHGFMEFYLILYHKKELIASYIKSLELPVTIHYIYEQYPMGTVGGLKLLEDDLVSDFLLCNCDNWGDFPYEQLLHEHKNANADLTIIVKQQTHTIPFGIVCTDENNVVKKIQEKPTKQFYISTGIHIVNPRFVTFIHGEDRIDMPTAINSAVEQLRIRIADIGDCVWKDMSLI